MGLMKRFIKENWFKLMVGSALVLFSISALIFSINYSVGVSRGGATRPWKMKYVEAGNKNSNLGDTVSYQGKYYRVIPSQENIGKKTIDLNRPLKFLEGFPKYGEFSKKSRIGDTITFQGKFYKVIQHPENPNAITFNTYYPLHLTQ